MKKFVWLVYLLAVALVIAGCSNSNNGEENTNNEMTETEETPVSEPEEVTPDPTPSEPVTLTMLPHTNLASNFEELITIPMQEHYPHITVELLEGPYNPNGLQNLIAAGAVPDLVSTWNGQLPAMEDMGVLQDLTPLVRQLDMDLTRFAPVNIESSSWNG